MTRSYSPKRFFRQVPNCLLKQYFDSRGVLTEIDFNNLTETKIEPVYEAWLKLPENIRDEIEQDFQEIDELANESGATAILDVANYHEENLVEKFAELDDFHARVFWTFLEHGAYWKEALVYYHADAIPLSYWRKRKNIPHIDAKTDEINIKKFEEQLGNYFYTTQGRGQNCKVECYKRNDSDYFFAYPEDYAQANVEWEGKEFKRRPCHPAFEIIFVYSQNDGTLNIYLKRDRTLVPDLQKIFADTILQTKLGDDKKDEQVYNLTPLLSRDFQFIYNVETGIESVIIKKLRFTIYDTKERILLESNAPDNKHAILDLLDKVKKGISLQQMRLMQVGIKVKFMPNPMSRKSNTRSFDISYPNSCSLKHDERGLILRKMLVDSKIEPQEPDNKNK